MPAFAKNLIFPDELRDFYEIATSALGEHDATQLLHVQLDPGKLPQTLHNFLLELNLEIGHAEVFFTPSLRTLNVHIDGEGPSNLTKLNWCYGAPTSTMAWFRKKDEAKLMQKLTTGIGTSYSYLPLSEAVMICSAQIKTPTLVNVGVPHGVINYTKTGRTVLSVVLRDRDLKENLDWKTALDRFHMF